MAYRSMWIAVGASALAAVTACSGDDGAREHARAEEEAAGALASSSRAAGRLAELRERFVQRVRAPLPAHLPEQAREDEARQLPVIGAGAVESFAPVEGQHVRAVVTREARRAASRPAVVALPVRASGAVHLEDETSHLAIDFVLEGAQGAEIAADAGTALYEGALPGADLVHRVSAEGTEDYVVLEREPEREELRYTVDVASVAGMRLVGGALEFLDREGTPRLRVAAPYLVDAAGERREATMAVEGCAYDTDPRGPWGRPVTAPGARSCGLRVAWAGARYPAVVDPSWMTTGSMATARYSHTATLLANGQVLVVGGLGNGSAYLGTAELYDPATGTWSATGNLFTGLAGHTASVLANGKVLVAGGFYKGNSLQMAELYDPATGAWKVTGSLAAARAEHTASVLANGKVLVAGGSGPQSLASAELFDPATGTWSATGDLVKARDQHTASVLANGKVLIAAGHNNFEAYLGTAELYDPATGTWSATGSLSGVRNGHSASVLANGKVLVAGGFGTFNLLGTAELFDPATGTWSATGSLLSARENQTASVLSNGDVLVAGGTNGNNLASAEIYDAAKGTWSAAGDMVVARTDHRASVLANGKVLVTGGEIPPGSVFASAELYGSSAMQGAPCVTSADCASGFCVDGVCCDTACNGGAKGCGACSKAAGAPADGTCAMLSGTPCDDGDACTQADACQAGQCAGKNPVSCMPQDECHDAGTCDSMKGTCSNPSKPDGTMCSGGTCQNGTCQSGTGGTGAGGSGTGGNSAGGSGTGGADTGGSDTGGSAAPGTGGSGGHTSGGCGCTTAPESSPGWLASLLMLASVPLMTGLRRARRARRS